MRQVDEQRDYLMRLNGVNLAELDRDRLEEITRNLLESLVSIYSCLARETRSSEIIQCQQETIQGLTDQVQQSQQIILSLNDSISQLEDPTEAFHREMILTLSRIIAREYHTNKDQCIADVLSGIAQCLDRDADFVDDALFEFWNVAKQNNFWRPLDDREDEEKVPEEDNG